MKKTILTKKEITAIRRIIIHMVLRLQNNKELKKETITICKLIDRLDPPASWN